MVTVPRLSRAQPLTGFTEALEKHGCVIITDFTDAETVARANQEVKPWLDGQGNEGAKVGGKTPSKELLFLHPYADPAPP